MNFGVSAFEEQGLDTEQEATEVHRAISLIGEKYHS